jgi:hypothetical protein
MRKKKVKMHIFFGIALLFLYLCLHYVDMQHEFNKLQSHWGCAYFIPLGELFDPSRGYLVNNALVVEVEIICCVDENEKLTAKYRWVSRYSQVR